MHNSNTLSNPQTIERKMLRIDTCDTIDSVKLTRENLELLERQMIGTLYTVWKLQGKKKKIIKLK